MLIKLGLCEGRHDIKGVTQYIFPADFFKTSKNMFDFRRMRKQIRKIFETISFETNIDIYVTGYTPALIEVINYLIQHKFLNTVFMHYNKDKNDYEIQELFGYYDYRR